MEALRIGWPRFGRKLTRVLHWMYFVALTLVTFLKLLHVFTLFYATPIFDPEKRSAATFVQTLDRLWMLLAAVLPIVLAELERRSEPGLYFVVTAAGAQPDDPEGNTISRRRARETTSVQNGRFPSAPVTAIYEETATRSP